MHRHGATCTDPDNPITNDNPQPTVTKISQDGVRSCKDNGPKTWVPDSGTPKARHAVVSSPINVPKEATPIQG